MASAGSSEVINWADALQQCGDDEEFLRELLADLRTETETQVANIAATIQVCLLERSSEEISSDQVSTNCFDTCIPVLWSLTNSFPPLFRIFN